MKPASLDEQSSPVQQLLPPPAQQRQQPTDPGDLPFNLIINRSSH